MNRRTFLKGLGIGAALAGANTFRNEKTQAEATEHVWRMVTSWTKTLPILQNGAEQFAENLAIMSGGRLKIQVYSSGELVGGLEVFDAVSSGKVECGHAASYYWPKKVPAARWFATVPFGLKASELNTWLHKGGGLDLWKEVYAPHNVIPMPAGNTGIQMGGWFNKAIAKPEDFMGLKIRMPGLGGRVLSKLGAEVINLAAGDIYPALKSGEIDATEWIGPYDDMHLGFHRIAKYYYAPGWHEPGTGFEFIVNRSAYDSLPKDLKIILKVATMDLATEIFTDYEYHNTVAMLKIAKERKVQLRLFPQVVLKELEVISAKVLEEEASRDEMSGRVHEAYIKFKKDIRKFALLKGAKMRI